MCEDPIVLEHVGQLSVGWKQWGAKGNMCFGPRGVTEFPWQMPSPGIWVTEDAERDRGGPSSGAEHPPPPPPGSSSALSTGRSCAQILLLSKQKVERG